MSVFKLSGNMALASGLNPYPHLEDLAQVKNSLKLLKSKQAKKNGYEIPDNNFAGYNSNNQHQYQHQYQYQQKNLEGIKSSIPSSIPKYATKSDYKSNYDYGQISKNHMPLEHLRGGKNTLNSGSNSAIPQYNKYGKSNDPYNYQYHNIERKIGQVPRSSELSLERNKKDKKAQKSDDRIEKDRTYSNLENHHSSVSKEYGSKQTEERSTGNENRENYIRIRGRGHSNYDNSTWQDKQHKNHSIHDGKAKHHLNSQNATNHLQKRYISPPILTTNNHLKIRQQEHLSRPQFSDYSALQELPLKQANQQNRVDISQYNPNDLVKCRQGCGRTFNPDSISKHEKICKKVFQKKRKQFDSAEHRVVEEEMIMARNGISGNKLKKHENTKVNKTGVNKNNIPKWKMQSLALRAILKQNRNQGLSTEEQKMLQKTQVQKDQGMIKCPFCGRNFNETAGPRHISFCEQQKKKVAHKK